MANMDASYSQLVSEKNRLVNKRQKILDDYASFETSINEYKQKIRDDKEGIIDKIPDYLRQEDNSVKEEDSFVYQFVTKANSSIKKEMVGIFNSGKEADVVKNAVKEEVDQVVSSLNTKISNLTNTINNMHS